MSADQKHQQYPKRDRVQPPGRSPAVRLDGATIDTNPNSDGTYDVTIAGHGLRMMISPPAIDIGGMALQRAVYSNDGKRISGVVTEMPSERRVVVDYGFARDETELAEASS